MKKVVKVSIGNIAFTIAEDAHLILNEYLADLSKHYKNKQSGDEIIDGIEERIAELLYERGGKESVVTSDVIKEIIAVLGKAEDIDQEEGENRTQENEGRVKKLYRDPLNKVFGGVCGGLAAFFNRDALLFRVLFVILFIGFSIFHWHFGGSFFAILYIVLWIVVPAANTTEQRCAMRGESPSIQDIQKNINNGMKNFEKGAMKMANDSCSSDIWKNIARVIEIFIGFIFTIIGLSGLAIAVISFFGFEILGYSFSSSVSNMYSIFFGGVAGLWLLKISVILPFIGLLYAGIVMLFNFKSPKWKPGLIIFILWFLSVIGVAFIVISNSMRFINTEECVTKAPLSIPKDTLYIEYAQLDKWGDSKVVIDADEDDFDMFFLDDSKKNAAKFIYYPEVNLYRNDEAANELVAKTNIIHDNVSLKEFNSFSEIGFFSLKGDTLILDPIVYERDHPYKEYKSRVNLHIGNNTEVIIQKPIYHQFKNNFKYSNIDWVNNFNFIYNFN